MQQKEDAKKESCVQSAKNAPNGRRNQVNSPEVIRDFAFDSTRYSTSTEVQIKNDSRESAERRWVRLRVTNNRARKLLLALVWLLTSARPFQCLGRRRKLVYATGLRQKGEVPFPRS